jgi:hypothetical protein
MDGAAIACQIAPHSSFNSPSSGVVVVIWRYRVILPCAVAALGAICYLGCSDPFAANIQPPAPVGGREDTDDQVVADGDNRSALLKNVLRLIQDATTNHGGDRINIASKNLNHYFANVNELEFRLPDKTRDFLAKQLGEKGVADLETPRFERRDGRHIEDCLLYQSIASRVAGDGDDLTRTRRIFQWVTQNIVLVPPGSLAPPGGEQAQARPFDVLLRGMATEVPGTIWAERSWVFMTLCRQISVDVGLIVHNVSNKGPAPPPSIAAGGNEPATALWISGAAIGDQLYLFDCRIGMEIPGPSGNGVATLAQAATDPSILNQLHGATGAHAYPTTQADLVSGPILILFDPSPGYLSGRMRLLEKDLSGKDRMVLYRDPVEQAANFEKAIGTRFGGLGRWDLPLLVESQLFTNGKFVEATQYALRGFEAELPLVHARISQLRGALKDAIEKYVRFRFSKGALQMDGKTPIPPHVQNLMNMYATYFLALAKLENKESEEAAYLFQQSLAILPRPRPGAPPFSMLRFGAYTNLGSIYERSGDAPRAARYYAEESPTPQSQGNLVRARNLVWRNPMAIAPPEPPRPGAGLATEHTAANP